MCANCVALQEEAVEYCKTLFARGTADIPPADSVSADLAKLERYFNKADAVAGSIELATIEQVGQAYIDFCRYSTIVLRTLKQHPEWAAHAQKSVVQKRCRVAIGGPGNPFLLIVIHHRSANHCVLC